MRQFLLRFTLLALVVALVGCSSGKNKKPKSSSRLYEGDSPTIHFNNERETAGGMFNPS